MKKSCIILNCNSNLTLHLFIYLVGLQTKGKFACLVCGSRIKSRRSRSLAKEVFDEYRHFLPKNHSYQTTDKAKFNGKEEVKVHKLFMYDLLYKSLFNFISINLILSH